MLMLLTLHEQIIFSTYQFESNEGTPSNDLHDLQQHLLSVVCTQHKSYSAITQAFLNPVH